MDWKLRTFLQIDFDGFPCIVKIASLTHVVDKVWNLDIGGKSFWQTGFGVWLCSTFCDLTAIDTGLVWDNRAISQGLLLSCQNLLWYRIDENILDHNSTFKLHIKIDWH